MLPLLAEALTAELADLEAHHRLRACPSVSGSDRARPELEGRPVLSFCSNDYLGLANHPDLTTAANAAAGHSGLGASASRLISGDLPELRALEATLAAYLRVSEVLVFPTGTQANQGVLQALAGPEDLIVSDRANHASLIDGCRLSRAAIRVYPHLDAEAADRALAHGSFRRRILVTESLFSMDGDVAPLQQLATIAARHQAAFVVDEAHALGVLGPSGRGLCAEAGIFPDVLVGTLGKAFAAAGGFAAGAAPLRSYLVNRARTFIYTTGLPPPMAAAAARAVEIAAGPDGEARRRRLLANRDALLDGLADLGALPGSPAPGAIHPLLCGSDAAALEASARLSKHGIFVQAIRPPTVAPGTARLRLTLSAAHTHGDVARLLHALRGRHAPNSAQARMPAPSEHRVAPAGTPSPHRGLVLLGTDTGVGKSTVGSALLRLGFQRARRLVPSKPAETGVPATGGAPHDTSDAARLLIASRRLDLPLAVIRPFAFSAPVAPAAAATDTGSLQLEPLLRAVERVAQHGDAVLVETVGGVLSPYAEGLSSADFAQALGLPVLLVARNGLGTINHTALAVAEIRRRGLVLVGVLLVDTTAEPTPDRASNPALIAAATGVRPLGPLPYVPSGDPDQLAALLAALPNVAGLLATLDLEGAPRTGESETGP